jgi:tetratricopeptide (TPR) repeat protein
MGYNYYNYLVPIERSAEPRALFDQITEKFAAKFTTERIRDTITVKFDDWKMWVHFSEEPHVIIESQEMAENSGRPELADCPARLEIHAEDDPNMDYFNEHLYVLEVIEPNKGVYIFDPVNGTFPYDDDLEESLDNDDDHPELADGRYQSWSDLAIDALIDEEIDKGIGYFEKSIEVAPNYWGGYANLGYYLLLYGQPDRAIEYTIKAIALGNISNSYLNKGHYQLIKGDRAGAIESYVISRWAFNTEEDFWEDFESDYEVLPQYGITEEQYEKIREEVSEKIKFPPISHN